MSLVASYDHPIVPVRQYSIHNPPAVANVTVTHDGQPLIVPASAYVINEAGATSSKSPARMYCYNMLAYNNFANQFFDDVVKTCVDVAVYISRGGQSVLRNSGLPDVVRQVLGLFTSELIVYTPELRAVTPQNISAGAMANVEALARVRDEAASLYVGVSPAPHHPHQARPGIPGRPAYPGHSAGHVSAHANPIAGAALGGQPANPPVGRPTSRYPQPAGKVVEKPKAEETKSKPTGPKLIQGEIEKMDRAAHSIVYFGHEYGVQTPPLRRRFEEAIEAHEQLAKQIQTHEDISQVTPFISGKWVAEASLDELVATTRASYVGNAKEGLQVFLTLGLLVTPIISSRPMSELFATLSRATSFAEVSAVLREESKRGTGDQEAMRGMLATVSQIDRKLTTAINDWLAVNIEGTVAISSFIEDISELLPYLNKKFQNKYNNAFMGFQKKVMAMLFKHGRASKEEVAELANYGLPEDGVYCDSMATLYSLAYVSATANELGYNVTRQPGSVTKSSAVMLHRLLSALNQSQQVLGSPSQHLLITADDVRYLVYPSAVGDGSFTLVER